MYIYGRGVWETVPPRPLDLHVTSSSVSSQYSVIIQQTTVPPLFDPGQQNGAASDQVNKRL